MLFPALFLFLKLSKTDYATLITQPQIRPTQNIESFRTNHAHFELHLNQLSILLPLHVVARIQIKVLTLIELVVTESIELAAFLLDDFREHILMQLGKIRFLRVESLVARH